jgi:hypothetical protein
MNHTTMKRDGGWTIALVTPIDGVAELNISPITMDHNIRWGDGLIPSVLALLSELTGVKETSLRRMMASDSERRPIALSYVVPHQHPRGLRKNVRPLATPFEEMSPELQYDVTSGDNDPEDPRFPRMPKDVIRYGKQRPPEAQTARTATGASRPRTAAPEHRAPEVMRKVGDDECIRHPYP